MIYNQTNWQVRELEKCRDLLLDKDTNSFQKASLFAYFKSLQEVKNG